MATAAVIARTIGSCAASAATRTSISSPDGSGCSGFVTRSTVVPGPVCKNEGMTVRRRQAGQTQPAEGEQASRSSRGDTTAQAILDTAERLLAKRSLREIGIDELT